MTVIDFVTDVLRQLVIISEIETPSAEQGADAVTKFNDMMASLEGDDIKLGWNPKATTADTLVLPAEHMMGLKAMLGVRLAEGYGQPVPPVMQALANAGYERMLRQSLHQNMRETRTALRGDAQRWNEDITQ
jgi:hypothetical protein